MKDHNTLTGLLLSVIVIFFTSSTHCKSNELHPDALVYAASGNTHGFGVNLLQQRQPIQEDRERGTPNQWNLMVKTIVNHGVVRQEASHINLNSRNKKSDTDALATIFVVLAIVLVLFPIILLISLLCRKQKKGKALSKEDDA